MPVNHGALYKLTLFNLQGAHSFKVELSVVCNQTLSVSFLKLFEKCFLALLCESLTRVARITYHFQYSLSTLFFVFLNFFHLSLHTAVCVSNNIKAFLPHFSAKEAHFARKLTGAAAPFPGAAAPLHINLHRQVVFLPAHRQVLLPARHIVSLPARLLDPAPRLTLVSHHDGYLADGFLRLFHYR